MTSQAQRLAHLEHGMVPAPVPDREAAARWAACCAALEATMAPAHARVVADVWRAQAAGAPVRDGGAARLAAVALDLLTGAYHGSTDERLALPPVVAAAYLNVGGHPFDRCVACRLPLPSAAAYERQGRRVPAWHPFARCPDCGGAVAHHADGRVKPATGLVGEGDGE